MHSSTLLSLLPLLSLGFGSPVRKRQSNEVFNAGASTAKPGDITDGGPGSDSYTLYQGDGSKTAGWPSTSQWVGFDDMFNANKQLMFSSCSNLQDGNNDQGNEIGQIYNAIQSAAYKSNVDHRFILAIIMQESKGCVRVQTTNNAISNPGLMQDHDGAFSCAGQSTCQNYEIFGMIYDGVLGTSSGLGLAGIMNEVSKDLNGAVDAQTYYTAARFYNSGVYDPINLDDGEKATNCYATDVANRLTGWVNAPHGCSLDDPDTPNVIPISGTID